MPFCSNCGNALSEDTFFCSACGSKNQNIKGTTDNSEQVNFPCNNTSATAAEPIKKNNTKLGFIVIISVLIIVGYIIGSLGGGTSRFKKYRTYEKAIEAFSEGLNEVDAMKVSTAMLTEDMIDSMGESYLEGIENVISTLNGILKEAFDKKPKWEITPKSKTELNDSEINEIEYYYSSHLYTDIEIEEAYRVKAKLKVCGESEEIFINVIKIKGEGWKVSEQTLETLVLPSGLSN